MTREETQLLASAVAEMRRLNRPVVICLDIASAISLAGAIQLAQRHPEFASKNPGTETICRDFIDQISARIPPEFPAIKKLIDLGKPTI